MLSEDFSKVTDISEIKNEITRVKKSGDEWYTNLYISDETLKRHIEHKQIYLLNFSGGFIVIRDRVEFNHIYFCVDGLESLKSGLLLLKPKILSAMVVDLLAPYEPIKTLLVSCGFAKYCSLTRMLKRNVPMDNRQIGDENFANEKEAEEVLAIINENMDSLCEQIPDIEEIETAARNKNILVQKDDKGATVALLYFERNSKSAYLRYWATSKKVQGMGYGKKLYNLYEAMNLDVAQFKLWVRDDNPKVRRAYENYGYTYDRLTDEVFVLEARK